MVAAVQGRRLDHRVPHEGSEEHGIVVGDGVSILVDEGGLVGCRNAIDVQQHGAVHADQLDVIREDVPEALHIPLGLQQDPGVFPVVSEVLGRGLGLEKKRVNEWNRIRRQGEEDAVEDGGWDLVDLTVEPV
jgi:hypothetical protein